MHREKSKGNFHTFKKVIRDPRSKTRLIFDLLLVFVVIGIIGLVLAENNRHNKLQASAEKLRTNFESEGIQVSEVSTDCNKGSAGKTPTSFHKCTLGFSYKVRKITIEEGNKIVEKANKALSKTDGFSRKHDDSFGYIDENGRNYRDPGVNLTHEKTKTECSLYYDSDLSSYKVTGIVNFELHLTCDDDSWFNRTFRN